MDRFWDRGPEALAAEEKEGTRDSVGPVSWHGACPLGRGHGLKTLLCWAV